MKIYVIKIDMTNVLDRLKKFKLQEFNHEYPEIFIEAQDPDEACHLCHCKFAETILRNDSSTSTANFIKELENDFRILKVKCKDEKKL